MPRPVYIICAQSHAQDKETNLVSLFNIVEKITISKVPETTPRHSSPGHPHLRLVSVAVWRRSEDDSPGEEYVGQTVLHIPGAPGGPKVSKEQPFSFSHPLDLYRFATAVTLSGPCESGLMRVEHRIRKVGGADWLSQEYPIFVEDIPLSPGRADRNEKETQQGDGQE